MFYAQSTITVVSGRYTVFLQMCTERHTERDRDRLTQAGRHRQADRLRQTDTDRDTETETSMTSISLY